MSRTTTGASSPAAESLAVAIEAALGHPATGLRRLSGGASRETWSFDAGRGFILQRRRAGSTDGSSSTTMSLSVEAEAAVLRAAHRAGVPVAAVVASGDGVDDGFGGPWMICERVEGDAFAKTLLTDPSYAHVRSSFAADAGRAMGRIHSIPLDGLDSVLRGAGDGPLGPIVGMRHVLDGLRDLVGLTYPTFELALRWLECNPTTVHPDAVVHGDFRTGNLLVCADDDAAPGLSAVLDWELCHIGNPIEDLGWFCVRAWRFGMPHRAGGFGPAEQLLEGYRDETGVAVSLEELSWWELLGTVRWGVVCGVQVASHLSGAVSSVELAAIGRRAAEVEYDTLILLAHLAGFDLDLDPAAAPAPAVPAAPGPEAARRPHGDSGDSAAAGLHGRPSALELLAAVREFLRSDVVEATSGHTRYNARVAANVLAMVERELRSGPGPGDDHVERLHSVGVADEAALAHDIRLGRFDDRIEAVASVLWPAVNERVEVTNPRYRG